MVARKIITKTLQRYWRSSRGLRLEVRAVVRAAGGRVLLVRDGAGTPWRLPGATVAKNEAAEAALARGLAETWMVMLLAPARLVAMESEERPADMVHVALYAVTSWRLGGEPAVRDQNTDLDLFEANRLPRGLCEGVRTAISHAIGSRKSGQIC